MTLEQRYKALLSQPLRPRKSNILESPTRQRTVQVFESARIGGLLIIAPSGWGKSILSGKSVALSDCQHSLPQIIIDVGGQTIQNFLHSLLFVSPEEQRELVSRVLYFDMAGTDGYISSWPMLFPRRPQERLFVTASRLPELLGQLDENFANATIQGLTRTIPIATTVGKLLTALQLPITEAFDLLRHPERWEERITEAVRRNPEAASAAEDMADYVRLSPRTREERVEPFLNRLQLLRHDEVSKALFGSTRPPSLDFEQVSRTGQTVLIDLSHEHSAFARQWKLLSVFNALLEYIEHRGRGVPPLSVVIDELSYFVRGAAYVNTHAIAEKFRQMIEQNMRNNRVYLTLATQDMKQIPEEMLTACLNLKSFLLGAQSDPETASYLADRFMLRNPWEVKYWERVWASESLNGLTNHFVIDHRPVFLTLEEQLYLNSRDFMTLRKGEWYFAQSVGEGEIATSVRKIISPHLFDGPFVSENKDLLQQLRLYLTRRDGLPLRTVLAEIDEKRLPALPEQTELPGTHEQEKEASRTAPSTNGSQTDTRFTGRTHHRRI